MPSICQASDYNSGNSSCKGGDNSRGYFGVIGYNSYNPLPTGKHTPDNPTLTRSDYSLTLDVLLNKIYEHVSGLNLSLIFYV